MARAGLKQDHHRVTGASIRPPSHWRRPCGRPRTSWLRTTDTDVQSVDIGIHSAWRKASDSGDVLSTRQHSTMEHATEERERERVSQSAHFFCPSSPHRFSSAITGKNRDVVRPSSLCSRVVLVGTTARPGPPGPVPDMDKLFREMKAVGSSPHRVAVSSFRPINVNCRRHKSPSGPRPASSRPAVTDNSYSRATPLQMSYR